MVINTFTDARVYLEQFIVLQRQHEIHLPSGVTITPQDKVRYLLHLLGNPQNTFPSVVVSGTAGKGSTTYLITQLLVAAGYKTGRKISPHLQTIRERFTINGTQISREEFIALTKEIQQAIHIMEKSVYGKPAYVHILMAMAFLYFSKNKVDIAVIEVGLENKDDPTAVLHPLAFIITNIGLDHTEILGSQVNHIAKEATWVLNHTKPTTQQIMHKKTSISGPIVISTVTQPSIRAYITDLCRKQHLTCYLSNESFFYTVKSIHMRGSVFTYSMESTSFEHLSLSLLGIYQIENASIAITTVLQLQQFGFTIHKKNIEEVLANASFAGRFEILHQNIILDVAHNALKMRSFLHALHQFYPKEKKIFLIAFKNTKNVKSMLRLLVPYAYTIIVTEFHVIDDPQKDFSMQSEEVYKELLATQVHIPIIVIRELDQAFAQLKKYIKSDVIGVVTGSVYLIGEIKNMLRMDAS